MESEVRPVYKTANVAPTCLSPGNRHEGMDVVTIDPNAVSNTRGRFQYSGNPTFQASRLPGGPSPAGRISELVVTTPAARGGRIST